MDSCHLYGESVVYHTIQFAVDYTMDVELSGLQPIERRRVLKGSRRLALLKPYVMGKSGGYLEVADLFFDDGTSTRAVPFACFSFVD
jgi:hypothetical protein